MRIAICDDEPVFVESLRKLLEACDVFDEDVEVSEYTDGMSLLSGHTKCPYDIVLLDIEMESMTGLEAGQRLRSMDRNVLIIYITGFIKYALDSFRIEPFDYLLKPIDHAKMNDVLGRALKKLREKNYIVDFRRKDKHYALKVCDIVYLESRSRHITFYTHDRNGEDPKCIGKLDEYERSLSPYGFLRCHQSYLINMSYIKCIDTKTITTTLGTTVDMSARKKQYCLNAFNEYITKYRV